MGLILYFQCQPSPGGLDVADDSLPALVDVDMFDRNLLLPFATLAIEGFQQRRVCPDAPRLVLVSSSARCFLWQESIGQSGPLD